MLSIDTKFTIARLLVMKSKSYRSIFCRIQSEFFEIQHSKPNAKFVCLRLVEFTKNIHVFYTSTNFSLFLHLNILLPEIFTPILLPKIIFRAVK